MTNNVGQVEWELNNIPDLQSRVRSSLGVSGVGGATLTVGAANSGTVAIQLLDKNGEALAEPAVVMAYLADAADGLAPTGADPSGGTAIGTDGYLISLALSPVFWLISEADGDIDLVLTEAGAATWYLVLVLPDGTLAISGAIDFTV